MKEKTKVAVCSRSFSEHPILRKEMLDRFENVTFNNLGKSLKGDELVKFLEGHEKAITALEIIDDSILSRLPDLKVIGKYGVGTDMLDFKALSKHNVKLGWTAGVNRHSVAELTISFAINLLRGINFSNQQIKNKIWKQYKGKQLSEITFGIIGCGNVGKEVVKLLKAFGAKVIVNDIVDYNDFYKAQNVEAVSLENLLKLSDIVSLHIPLTSVTTMMFNKELMAKMKPGAFLINTARGNIVDENILYEALITNTLAGAAFDVFKEEPPSNYELINLPNFLCTPHIGGSSNQAIIAMGMAAINGLTNYRDADEYM